MLAAVSRLRQLSGAPSAVAPIVDDQPVSHCSTALAADHAQRPIGGGVVQLGDEGAVRSGELLDATLGLAPINWSAGYQSPFVLLGYLARP